MATGFSRSSRSLGADRFTGSILFLAVTLALLGAWLWWFLLARIDRYEVTEKARLEVDRAAHLLQAPVAGRVLSHGVVLGREVAAGEVLVELDTGPQTLALREERTRLAGLGPQIEAVQAEIDAQERAKGADSEAINASQEVARAQVREGAAMADLAAEEARRQERLTAEGLAPARDAARSKAEAQSKRAGTESLQLAVDRLERERSKNAGDRDAQLKRLRGEIAKMEGERATIARTIARLEYEIERRKIRAPVSGRIGEVSQFRVGAFLAEGEKLGAIVPAGGLKIIAEFAPAAALGRIRPGQPARMRLEGFPWAQYGTIAATVSNVASEVRDGRLRVELAVSSAPSTPLPMQHGLPGAVEVLVERVAPATIALRAAGQLLAAPKNPYPVPEPAR